MTKDQLFQLKIVPPDPAAGEEVRRRWDRIAKPLDGLGRFEELTVRIGAMTGEADLNLQKRTVVTFCADNGIVEEGVTQTGQEVTAAVALSIARGTASVARMARLAGVEVIPVDIGICAEEALPGLKDCRIRKGTANFLKEPAMTEEECLEAIGVGIGMAQQCRREGVKLLAAGEMGIGNTTTGSAVSAALLGCRAEEVTGRGAGLHEEGFRKKREVIDRALEQYGLHNADPLTVLSTVGGLDIAGMTGLFIGGALCRLPVVLDGMISAAAALAAEKLLPGCRAYMIPSHLGKEPASGRLLCALSLSPLLHADLALGEGTGAVMMMALLELALSVYRENPSFSALSITPYERFPAT